MNATAQLELDATRESELFADLHKPASDDEEIYSRFYDPELKSTWYSLDTAVELPQAQSEMSDGGVLTYAVPPSLSYLKAVFMVANLPGLDVAEEFKNTVRVAWTPNLAYALVDSGVFHVGESETHPIDKHTICMFFQYNLPLEFRRDHEYAIGNRPELTEFSTSLPAGKQVGCPHPHFFYRVQEGGHVVKLTQNYFEYVIMKDLENLVRCQVLEDGKWRDCELERHFLVKWEELRRPQLYALASYNTQAEMLARRIKDVDTPKNVYITEVFHLSSTNPTDTREVFSDLRQSPTKAIITAMENMDATARRVHCNYTADPEDYVNGPDPLMYTEVKYDVKRRLIDRSSNVLSKLIPMECFSSVPWRNGWHAQPLCLRPFERLETGVVLGHEKIKASIRMEYQNGMKTKYTAHTFLIIQRQLRYTLNDDGSHSVTIV